MTTEDILEYIATGDGNPYASLDERVVTLGELRALVKYVQKEERERCAKVAESWLCITDELCVACEQMKPREVCDEVAAEIRDGE